MSTDRSATIEVCLDLSQHCIETAARRAYRAAVTEALDMDGADPALEARITLLKDLLEHEDFKDLRARSPELAGGHPVEVSISRTRPGNALTWHLRERS